MKALIHTLTLTVFTVTTYIILNWLLDQNWNWELIGFWTVSVFSTIAALSLGACTAHVLLSLVHRQSQYDQTLD